MPAHPPFRPAWWLPGPHRQTLWAALARRPRRPATTAERLELPDGDFVDLAWAGPAGGPIAIVLHGLEGGLRSRYAVGVLAALTAAGYRAVLMHFRGCSGVPNRRPRSYHSGDTGDFAHLLRVLAARHPDVPRVAIGFSLGGNVLLKYLGETGATAGVAAAVAVSVPFDLADAAGRLERGASRLYQWHLLRSLRARTRARARALAGRIDLDGLESLRTFRAFDDAVTAPLHGFAGVDDYYARSSSRRYLAGITRPTLILHARDDPFMTPAAIPAPHELPGAVQLEVSDAGGHAGFVGGTRPWAPDYWLERRALAYFADHFAADDVRACD